MDAVQRQGELRFHQSVGNPRVVALALRDHEPVFVGLLPQVFLGGGELDLVLFADVVLDQVFQLIEDARAEDVHAEMGQVIAGGQSGRDELLAGKFDGRLFDDQSALIDPLVGIDRLALDRRRTDASCRSSVGCTAVTPSSMYCS